MNLDEDELELLSHLLSNERRRRFRFANYYRQPGGDSQRDLIKAYGILFIFTVSGRAGKFSIVPLVLNIGAGVALLSVVSTPSSYQRLAED